MEPANILKIDTLNEGWSDKDNVMLHACFQLLMDCIEKEKLHELTDWNQSEQFQGAKKEIDTLVEWWRQRVHSERAEHINPIWSDNQYEEDNHMLIQLIGIRQYLWT